MEHKLALWKRETSTPRDAIIVGNRAEKRRGREGRGKGRKGKKGKGKGRERGREKREGREVKTNTLFWSTHMDGISIYRVGISICIGRIPIYKVEMRFQFTSVESKFTRLRFQFTSVECAFTS